MPPPRLSSEYGSGLVEASRSALLELTLTLGSFRDSIVLVGGWAPYFLIEEFGNTDSRFLSAIENSVYDENESQILALKSIVRYYSFEKLDLLANYELIELNEFAKVLFDFNYEKGLSKNQYLKKFRTSLLKSIQTWNGNHFRQDLIYTESGDEYLKKSVKFDIDLIHEKVSPCENRFSFSTNAIFHVNGNQESFNLVIDFGLFKTVTRISKGYQLSAIERIESISLNDFIDKIIRTKSMPNVQYISNIDKKTFVITYDSTFESFEFKKE